MRTGGIQGDRAEKEGNRLRLWWRDRESLAMPEIIWLKNMMLDLNRFFNSPLVQSYFFSGRVLVLTLASLQFLLSESRRRSSTVDTSVDLSCSPYYYT